MIEKLFDTCSDGPVKACTLRSPEGMEAVILTYGATLQALRIPRADGTLVDVVQGFDRVSDYREINGYQGAVVGRYANRIAGAAFPLGDRTVHVSANERGNCLHGGFKGLSHRLWEIVPEEKSTALPTSAPASDSDASPQEDVAAYPSLLLTYTSPDGEEGFPGNARVRVRYTLGPSLTLTIQSEVLCDADCPISLTNHSYYNLDGPGTDVLSHRLLLLADRVTENDAALIPTGRILPVQGTALDFTEMCGSSENAAVSEGVAPEGSAPQCQPAHTLGERLRDPLLATLKGYDHNYCLKDRDADRHVLQTAAVLSSQALTMTLETDAPGLQFYMAPQSPVTGKDGIPYLGYCFICLEPQEYPDAIHHPNFPNALLPAGMPYTQTIRLRFEGNRS